MPILQELNHREITQVILSAAERNLPLSITVRDGAQWSNLQSRVVGLKNQQLLVEMPVGGQHALRDFVVGENIGVSLKLKHHKYLFLAGVAGREEGPAPEGELPLLVLGRPVRMQRLQRRAYDRAAVPAGCVARAAFWVGGRMNEPAGTSPDRPVWSGRVVDISAGGFSIRTTEETIRLLEAGYFVGTRLIFGLGQEAVYADARVRHVAIGDDGAVVGFQFMGLEYSEDGKNSLQAISRKVSEFQVATANSIDIGDSTSRHEQQGSNGRLDEARRASETRKDGVPGGAAEGAASTASVSIAQASAATSDSAAPAAGNAAAGGLESLD